MSKEEPAWKAELVRDLTRYDAYDANWLPLVQPHILAAEQRGFQAGVNKTGDSVGKLREQLKLTSAVRAEVLREAADRLDDLEYVGPGDELRRLAGEADSP